MNLSPEKEKEILEKKESHKKLTNELFQLLSEKEELEKRINNHLERMVDSNKELINMMRS